MTGAVAREPFETVAGWYRKFAQIAYTIELRELPARHPPHHNEGGHATRARRLSTPLKISSAAGSTNDRITESITGIVMTPI